MKSELTLTDVAVLLNISKRQVQRLLRSGELCGYINGQGKRVIKKQDFEAYQGKREAMSQVSEAPGDSHPSAAPGAAHPSEEKSPRIPAPEPSAPGAERPANPDGPISNVPTENSSNWPSKSAMIAHEREEHLRMVRELTGGVKPHEYPNDFEI